MKPHALLATTISLAILAGCEPSGQQVSTDDAPQAEAPAAVQEAPKSELHSRVDQVFADLDSDSRPGCALSVMEGGEVTYKQGYGMANLEHDIPIAPDSVFHIASISKQFTVFAVALLVEQGKVSWDDEVQKYFPEMPGYGNKVTLRHLAHNTSGIKDQWELLAMAGWRWESDLVTQRDATQADHPPNLAQF